MSFRRVTPRTWMGAAWLLAAAAWATEPVAAAAEPFPLFVRPIFVRGTDVPGCPTGEVFEREVTGRIGRDAFSEVSPTLLIVVIERGRAGGFQGQFHLRGADGAVTGERRMLLDSCRELVSSLAAAVSVVLDTTPEATLTPARSVAKEATLEPVEPSPGTAAAPITEERRPPELARPAPTASLSALKGDALPAPASVASNVWQVGLGPLVDYRELTESTSVSLGAALSLARVWPRFSLRAEARGLLPRRRPFDAGSISAFFAGGSLQPCWRAVGLNLCVAGSAGLVHATTIGFDGSDATTKPTLGAGLRVAKEIGGGRWRLQPYLHAEALLLRWRLESGGHVALREGRMMVGAGLEIVTDLP